MPDIENLKSLPKLTEIYLRDTGVSGDIADLKSNQDELIAAEAYYEKLVPQCIDQGMTWEEKVKARESEIASLKEALKAVVRNDRLCQKTFGGENSASGDMNSACG